MKRLSGSTYFNLIGLALGFLATSSLLHSKMEQEARKQHLDTQERAAVIETIAVRELTQEAVNIPEFEETGLHELVNAWIPEPSSNQSIKIIKLSGAKLLAVAPASAEADIPRRLAMDEKELFDQAKRLKTARMVNQEEQKARKPEIEVEYKDTTQIVVAAPLLKGDKAYGMVLNERGVTPFHKLASYSEAFGPLAGGILIFLAGVLFFGDSKLFRAEAGRISIGQTALALILFLAMILFWNHQLSSRLDEFGQSQLTSLQQAHQHGLTLLNPSDLNKAPALDLDRFQQDRGLLTANGQISTEKQVAFSSELQERAGGSLVGFTILGFALVLFFCFGFARKLASTIREHRYAYLYITPAILAMLVLVFFPFLFGISLSFTDSNIYNSSLPLAEIWVGLANYTEILFDFELFTKAADGTTLINYENFYWTLYITIMWTVCNVAIGVGIGLGLALILNTKGLKMRTLYRVLLILPWAIPNYITALIWNGMFHKQFGVINQVLLMVGLEPVAWFDGVFTSFLTGIATNGWLSFPFMMVVCLGGLQSISADMYEAAKLDGASRWQQFRFVTLPSLKIVLVPAIIISVVWTFNMFNIIFLVSGGQPGGANEILITKAYKIAFEQYQYGYAAAYSTVIFGILLIYGVFQMKMSKATEANT